MRGRRLALGAVLAFGLEAQLASGGELLPGAAPAGGPIDASAFRWSRRIPPGPPGLVALRLDAAVLAGSESLADLRVATADGLQVPYLLETLPEPLVVPLPKLEPAPDPFASERDGPQGRRSYHAVALPYPSPPGGTLSVPTTARIFQRHATLLFIRDEVAGSRRPGPSVETVAEATWVHADPETPAPPLTFRIPRLSGGKLVLALDDGDNSPLPLGDPVLALQSHRLRFFRQPGATLTLLYGASGLSPPKYDLALLSSQLLGAGAEEVSLEEPGRPPSPPANGKTTTRLFWGALVGAVVVLLVLVVRLVGKGETGRRGE